MTLAQLANIGEFLGGIGVFVTLFFVAVQLRQNTRACRDRVPARQETPS